MSTMHYDLIKPCKHCPFRREAPAIRFACKDRAREIAESAYRYGFPCHKSAVYVEDETGDGEFEGFYPGEKTQHCAGAIMMFMHDGVDCWPGVDNDEELVQRLWDQYDWSAQVFESEEEFIEANRGPDDE